MSSSDIFAASSIPHVVDRTTSPSSSCTRTRTIVAAVIVIVPGAVHRRRDASSRSSRRPPQESGVSQILVIEHPRVLVRHYAGGGVPPDLLGGIRGIARPQERLRPNGRGYRVPYRLVGVGCRRLRRRIVVAGLRLSRSLYCLASSSSSSVEGSGGVTRSECDAAEIDVGMGGIGRGGGGGGGVR